MELTLKRAQENLERKVKDRTNALRSANIKLGKKIRELLRIEKHIRASNELLAIASRVDTRKEYADAVVGLVIKWTGCACAGIRLIDEEKRIPYESYTGFSREFWESENWLSIRNDTCACIRAVTGHFLPCDKAAMTKAGSFFLNDSKGFADRLSDSDRGSFRGVCIKSGFSSIAVIPIKYRRHTVGAIHIADKKTGKLPLDMIEYIESLTPLIGEGLQKIEMMDKTRKTAELLKAAEGQVAAAKRLSDIGTLAAVVAHELRNPLGVIGIAAYNIKRKAQDPSLERHIDNINKKVSESNEIINNLLFYSRIRQPSYENVMLVKLLEECLDAAKKRHQDITTKFIRNYHCEEGCVIEADRLQISEVFSNLINNSFDALPDGKGIIEVGAVRDDKDGNVEVYIKDNGTGISKEDLPMVFQPFFTRKSKGTGLGLTVCKEILSLHGGIIAITSSKGKGTLVRVNIPSKRPA